jgi:hypothetical protein
MTTTATPPPPDVLELDAGVIEEARTRQQRHRAVAAMTIAAGIAAIVLTFAWGGGNRGAHSPAVGRPLSGGRGLARRDGGSGSIQLISIVGVSMVVPREWSGRTTVLSVGAGNSAWIQATSFAPQGLDHGEARIKAMRADDVAVTICECNEPIEGSTQRNRVRPLRLSGDVVAAARTPRGHVVLEASALLAGRLLTIDADFGSRNAARRLLAAVNKMLGTLRVRPARYG